MAAGPGLPMRSTVCGALRLGGEGTTGRWSKKGVVSRAPAPGSPRRTREGVCAKGAPTPCGSLPWPCTAPSATRDSDDPGERDSARSPRRGEPIGELSACRMGMFGDRLRDRTPEAVAPTPGRTKDGGVAMPLRTIEGGVALGVTGSDCAKRAEAVDAAVARANSGLEARESPCRRRTGGAECALSWSAKTGTSLGSVRFDDGSFQPPWLQPDRRRASMKPSRPSGQPPLWRIS